MIVIAILALVFAFARYFMSLSFGLGFVTSVGLIALFVVHSTQGRHYNRLGSFIIGYPLLPLLILHITWGVIKLRYARRSSVGFLDGMFGVSDIGALLCLMAYVGCVSVWLGTWNRQDVPELRSAAKRVVLFMPLAWIALFAVALWDPFGALGNLFQ
jgi:hypothetical protein